MSGYVLIVSVLGGRWYAADIPTIHKQLFTQKNDLIESVLSAKVRQLCFKVTCLFFVFVFFWLFTRFSLSYLLTIRLIYA